jgi:hypothetical protein
MASYLTLVATQRRILQMFFDCGVYAAKQSSKIAKRIVTTLLGRIAVTIVFEEVGFYVDAFELLMRE